MENSSKDAQSPDSSFPPQTSTNFNLQELEHFLMSDDNPGENPKISQDFHQQPNLIPQNPHVDSNDHFVTNTSDISNFQLSENYENLANQFFSNPFLPSGSAIEIPNWQHFTNLSNGNPASYFNSSNQGSLSNAPQYKTAMDALFEVPPSEKDDYTLKSNMLPWGNSEGGRAKGDNQNANTYHYKTGMEAFLEVPSSEQNAYALKSNVEPWMNSGGGNGNHGTNHTTTFESINKPQYGTAMDTFFQIPSNEQNGYTLSNMEPWMNNGGGGNGGQATNYTRSIQNTMMNYPHINPTLQKGKHQFSVNNLSSDFGLRIKEPIGTPLSNPQNKRYTWAAFQSMMQSSKGEISVNHQNSLPTSYAYQPSFARSTAYLPIGEGSQLISSTQPSTLHQNYTSRPQSVWGHSFIPGTNSSLSYLNSSYGNEKFWSNTSPSDAGTSLGNLNNHPSSSAPVLTKNELSKIKSGNIWKGSKTQKKLDPKIFSYMEMNPLWWRQKDPVHDLLIKQLLEEDEKRAVKRSKRKNDLVIKID